jgi:hypothetical protein
MEGHADVTVIMDLHDTRSPCYTLSNMFVGTKISAREPRVAREPEVSALS